MAPVMEKSAVEKVYYLQEFAEQQEVFDVAVTVVAAVDWLGGYYIQDVRVAEQAGAVVAVKGSVAVY